MDFRDERQTHGDQADPLLPPELKHMNDEELKAMEKQFGPAPTTAEACFLSVAALGLKSLSELCEARKVGRANPQGIDLDEHLKLITGCRAKILKNPDLATSYLSTVFQLIEDELREYL
jgi:hypothetical protein